ncbi:MAG: TonB-dependent receptor [Pseudomonadales bacterium]
MFKTKNLISVGIMIGLVSTSALAQEEEVEEVVVTGTRITTDGFESVSPVEVVTADEIRVTGQVRIEDVLNQFPQIETATNAFQPLGSGVATLDLRGMGSARTLILLNGRRMAPGSVYSETPDVGQMPLSMLERVDVLTGGASAVYGSDAIAGAVNFVTRQVEGVEISVTRGGYRSDQGANGDEYVAERMLARGFTPVDGVVNDGATSSYDVVMGISSGDGRGNISMYARHVENDDVFNRDRVYSGCALSGSGASCGGSSTTPVPHFDFYPMLEVTSDTGGNYDVGEVTYDYAMNFWGQLQSDGTLLPYSGNVYNYAQVATLLQASERDSMGAIGHYEVSSRFRPYFEVNYSSYHSQGGIAQSGTFYASYMDFYWDNPNWTDALQNSVVDGFVEGGDFTANYADYYYDEGTAQGSNVCYEDYDGEGNTFCADWVGLLTAVGKRNTEGGPRTGLLETDAVRWVIGANGEIGVGDFEYDLSYTYAQTTSSEAWINDFSLPAITAALEGGEGGYDVMTYQGVTAEQAANMGIDGMIVGNNTIKNLVGYVTGTTGWSLPSAESNIALVAGFENRETVFDRLADYVYANALALGFGGATPSISGSLAVTEFFGELNVPIIENVPGIQSLSMDLAYRSSDYDLIGQVETSRIGFTYLPTERIRVRAGINDAERAPTISNLYYPANTSLWSGTDYCAGSSPVYTAEQCARTGVTAAQYGGVPANPAGQYNSRIGGNPLLRNESAQTTTFGVVIGITNNITASVDVWNIDIDGAIASTDAETIIELCAVQDLSQYCQNINRFDNGSLWQGDAYVQLGSQNVGQLNWSGVDYSLAGSFDVFGGTLGISTAATNMKKKYTRSVAALEETGYECAGYIDSTCWPTPEWRTRTTATFSTGGSWSVGATLRTMSAVENLYTADAVATENLGKDLSWLDVNASYQILGNTTLRLSIQNLLDKQPPVVGDVLSGGYANTVSGNYDMLGQYWNLSIDTVF